MDRLFWNCIRSTVQVQERGQNWSLSRQGPGHPQKTAGASTAEAWQGRDKDPGIRDGAREGGPAKVAGEAGQ